MNQISDKKIRNFKYNIVKFIIGIILLSVSFSYISKNDAEKVAITSGFTVISQKIQVYLTMFKGGDYTNLDNQFQMQRTYKELLISMENSKCKNKELGKEITDKYTSLKTMQLDSFTQIKSEYGNAVTDYLNEINNCGTENN